VVEFAEFVPLVFATIPELQAHTMGLSLEIALRVAVEESLAAHHTRNIYFLFSRDNSPIFTPTILNFRYGTVVLSG
jgi:hypothetical protein